MKPMGKSPRGKALSHLIIMMGKHPSMLDKKHEMKTSHSKLGKPESPAEEMAHEEMSHEDPLHSEHEHEGSEMDDLNSMEHDHEDQDCHDECPVRIAIRSQKG